MILLLLQIVIEGRPSAGVGEYELEIAFPNLRFDRPLYLTHPHDGTDRIVVVEQKGVVHLFDNDRDARETATMIDLRSKVRRRHNEEGLLGIAFKEDVFLHYSASGPRRNVLSRFKRDGDRLGSERVLLEVEQPYGNHNGGMIEFGPDGYLYVSLGDGGDAGDPHGNGQNLDTLLGAILRVDADGKAPRDNPFVDRRGARPEIWAYGLRNVWRFSFDRATGDLWAGDVGQDRWEEIDKIARGGNYGWDVREGAHGKSGDFIDPVIEYGHREGKSVTGGYVYRGTRVPGLYGAYLYADYESGVVWAWKGGEIRRIARGTEIASFGEDRDGEVYLCSFDGQIYRLRPRRNESKFPTRISQTGVDVAVPANYEPRVPFWSDGAGKKRWIHAPSKIGAGFEFPVGTVFVKHFERDGKKLETRLLVQDAEGWAGYAYVWRGDDAFLLEDRLDLGDYTIPSRQDCMTCHNKAAGYVLGFEPNQIERHDLLSEAPAASPDFKGVAAYLAVNCGTCHRPGGPGNAEIDLSFGASLDALADAAPSQGDLGVRGAKIVVAGEPDRSLLVARMLRTDDKGMPPVGHHVVDRDGVELVKRWIESLR